MEDVARKVREPAHCLLPHKPLGNLNRLRRVLGKVFAKLQKKQTVRINMDVFSMDSTGVKIHPDAAGARKKTDLSLSECLAEVEIPKFIRFPRVTG